MVTPPIANLNNSAARALQKRSKSGQAHVSSKSAFHWVGVTTQKALPLVTTNWAVLGPGTCKTPLKRAQGNCKCVSLIHPGSILKCYSHNLTTMESEEMQPQNSTELHSRSYFCEQGLHFLGSSMCYSVPANRSQKRWKTLGETHRKSCTTPHTKH